MTKNKCGDVKTPPKRSLSTAPKSSGNVGEASVFTATVARPKLLTVYVVSWISRMDFPSTNSKIVSPPRERNKPWIEIFAVVKAEEPVESEEGIRMEPKYFLGYSGQEANLPNKARIEIKKLTAKKLRKEKRDTVPVQRWDKNKWGELRFDWHEITPFLYHDDPVMRQRSEKIDVANGPKEPQYTNKKQNFCQYTNYPVTTKIENWFPDTVEYKESSVDASNWISGGWGAKLNVFEGTKRYQVTVTYKGQVKNSPGRIIGRKQVEGKTENEACKNLGITSLDYKKLKRMEKVDERLLKFLSKFPLAPQKGLGVPAANKRFREYQRREKKACGTQVRANIYRILKSNLRKEDCDQYGIKPSVHRISIRSQSPNKYVSYLHAYVGVPWIFGTGGSNNTTKHQTELFQGIDCADFAVGAARAAQITSSHYVDANTLASTKKTLLYPVAEGIFYAKMNKGSLSITDPKLRNPPEIDISFGIGKSRVQVGDLILLDWDGDRKYDHTAIILGNKQGNILTKLNEDTLIISANYNKPCYDEKGIPQSGPQTETLGQVMNRHPTGAWFVLRRWKTLAQEIYVLLSGFKPWARMKWNPTQTIAERLHGKEIEMSNLLGGKSKVKVRVSSMVLPVHWFDAADTLVEEIRNWKYNIVIGLGMKPFPDLNYVKDQDLKFEMEPVAYNQNSIDSEDDRNKNCLQACSERGKGLLTYLASGESRNQISHTTNYKKVKDDGPEFLRSGDVPRGLPYSAIADAINSQFRMAPIRKLTDPSGTGEMDYKSTKGKVEGFAYVDNYQGTGSYVCNQINYNLLYYNLPDKRKDRFPHNVMAGFVHVPALDPAEYETELVKTAKIMVEVCARKYLKTYISN